MMTLRIGISLQELQMRIIYRVLRTGLIVCALAAASLAQGHESGPEFIESFDTMLELGDDGAIAASYAIEVHRHGDEIRRGVFFKLPEWDEGIGAFLNGEVFMRQPDPGEALDKRIG